MSDELNSDKKGTFIFTLLSSLGFLAIFLLILTVAYLPKRVAPAGDGVKSPEERKALLSELRGKEQTAANTYGWVDKEKGIVRIPISAAMEISIRELAAR